jgi:hypothetical protein
MESQAPLNPSDFEVTEAPAAKPTSLSPNKKPAGKPAVKQDKVKSQPKKKVSTPGLGGVSLTTH